MEIVVGVSNWNKVLMGKFAQKLLHKIKAAPEALYVQQKLANCPNVPSLALGMGKA